MGYNRYNFRTSIIWIGIAEYIMGVFEIPAAPPPILPRIIPHGNVRVSEWVIIA